MIKNSFYQYHWVYGFFSQTKYNLNFSLSLAGVSPVVSIVKILYKVFAWLSFILYPAKLYWNSILKLCNRYLFFWLTPKDIVLTSSHSSPSNIWDIELRSMSFHFHLSWCYSYPLFYYKTAIKLLSIPFGVHFHPAIIRNNNFDFSL